MPRRGIRIPAYGGFKPYLAACVLAGFLFASGIIFGAVAIKTLTSEQKAELLGYVDTLVRGVVKYSEPVSRGRILRASALNNLKTAAVMWFLGVTIIGIPVTMIIIFTRGFVLGFTTGFLIEEMGSRGLAFAAAAILPHNLIAIPAVLAIGVMSLSFSLMLIASKRAGRGIDFVGEFARYTLLSCAACLILLLSSLIEAGISPYLAGFVSARIPRP